MRTYAIAILAGVVIAIAGLGIFAINKAFLGCWGLIEWSGMQPNRSLDTAYNELSGRATSLVAAKLFIDYGLQAGAAGAFFGAATLAAWRRYMSSRLRQYAMAVIAIATGIAMTLTTITVIALSSQSLYWIELFVGYGLQIGAIGGIFGFAAFAVWHRCGRNPSLNDGQ